MSSSDEVDTPQRLYAMFEGDKDIKRVSAGKHVKFQFLDCLQTHFCHQNKHIAPNYRALHCKFFVIFVKGHMIIRNLEIGYYL